MRRRSLFAGPVVAALLMMSSAAQAGSIVVASDSGTIGGVDLTNMGVSGGTATIEITRIPNLFSFMNTVNGATVVPAESVSVEGPITLLVTPIGPEHYSLALVPPTYTETIGAVPGSQAEIAFDMKSGVAPAVLPNFFNMSGDVTALLLNSNPGYDFSKFALGGTMNITFTGTTFGGGIDSFAGLFSTPGSSIVANGSFSQSAVPEPASLALLGMGIGLPMILAWRRHYRPAKKT